MKIAICVTLIALGSVLGGCQKSNSEATPTPAATEKQASTKAAGGRDQGAATEACNGKQSGDACSMKVGERDVNGKCTVRGDKMMCRPERPEAGRARKSFPPEALAACQSKAADGPCTFKHNERDIEGKCHAVTFGEDSGKLVCMPARHGHGHGGGDGGGGGKH